MNDNQIIELLNKRYTTKRYDSSKKVSQQHIDTLVESFRMSPSSLGLQPWHLFVVASDEMKQKIAPYTADFNQEKIKTCSHVFVLANKAKMDDAHLDEYFEIFKQVRGEESLKNFNKKAVRSLLEIIEDPDGHYHRDQVFIALGFMAYTAGLLGIDSTIIGGFDAEGYDKVLGLASKGLKSSVIFTVGYQTSDESEDYKKKVRLPKESVVTFL